MLDILQFCASILNACLHAPFGRKRLHLISVSPASSVTPPASPVTVVATALPTSIAASTLVSATALTILAIVAGTEVVTILIAALISKLVSAPVSTLASVMVAKLVALLRTVRWHVHVGRWRLPHAIEVGGRRRGNEATTSLELRWGWRRNTEWRHWHRELALELA